MMLMSVAMKTENSPNTLLRNKIHWQPIGHLGKVGLCITFVPR